ncbi:MAG: winged helix-turn-helix domain-containing protein [Armatimonadota bacterium]
MLNLETFDKLDRVIHEKGRLAIMSLLAANESLSFRELKELLRMTDGNLSVHMRTLEEGGFVEVTKSFVNRKPRTEYSLTPAGREAFQAYIQALEEIVRQSQALEEPRPAREGAPVLRPGMAGAK